MRLQSINPFNQEIIENYDSYKDDQVDSYIESCHTMQQDWSLLSFKERAKLLKKLSVVLKENKEEYAKIITLEMGKVYKESLSEIEKCAWVLEYYAEKGEGFLKDEQINERDLDAIVSYQPLGVVLAVMPWNFPFWQVFRFAAPAIMAGNGALLKHASNVPGCALAIENSFRKAGFPEGLFKSLLIGSDKVKRVVENKLVKAVTLTGSTAAGKKVAQIAGSVLKKTVLELGGSDPYIVLPDADVDNAVDNSVTSRLINCGQSCIAAKRFIVCQEVYDEFVENFYAAFSLKKMGDPFAENIDYGPMANLKLRDELHKQVEISVAMGAKLLCGGQIPEGKGAFYPATILVDVAPGMPAYDEELFGPVASIIKVRDMQEAVKVANDTSFGLGAAIFSKDKDFAKEVAKKQIEAGACFVNMFVKSDPRLPFGGIKESGYGRELSILGIREFVNVKTICAEN